MLDKTYRPVEVEEKIYARWEETGAFACGRTDAAPYAIVIPPPNVTGSLHMGHALNNTLQDILVRFERMRGRDVLWQPGTDHAGIATQMVVERQLEAEGAGRRDLGREAFVERVWKWKAESGGVITQQLRGLGASCDWSRERFTMDEGLSAAVRKVFVDLYKEGLIYRDKRLVNWDPKLHTAISDLEVEQREVKGTLWYFKYPVEGTADESLSVATTRPETMLGDTGVAVHPGDPRYAHLVGRTCKLPIVGRSMPIIADAYADPEKGSGAVKMTPAHDFNDFEVGRRHGLDMVNVLDRDAPPQRQRARALPRPRPFRGAPRDCRRDAVPGPSRKGRGQPDDGALRRPLGRRRRALAHRPMVRRRQDPGGAGHGGGRAGAHPVRARQLGQHLLRVDAQHPALVHLAPALVGPPDPGLVRSRWRYLRRDGGRRGRGRGRGTLRPGGRIEARRGRARHLVLVGAVAVLDSGVARADAGAGALLPDRRAGHRLRHHLLLGRPHDDDGAPFPRPRAVPHGLHPRLGARRARPEDVEIQGQHHRSPGADQEVRHRTRCASPWRRWRRRGATFAWPRAASRATATSSPSSGTRRATAR